METLDGVIYECDYTASYGKLIKLIKSVVDVNGLLHQTVDETGQGRSDPSDQKKKKKGGGGGGGRDKKVVVNPTDI